MKKSKYFKMVKINSDCYAIFNSLLLEPFYVDKKTALNIKYNRIKNISEKDLDEFKRCGIIVSDDFQDGLVISTLKKQITNEIKNKISVMYIIPNSSCNLMCKYCFIGKLNNDKPQIMSYDTMKNAVDKFAAYAVKQDFPCKIMFYGGEPLISFNNIKRITEYIKVKKYNLKLSMVTNGTLLNDEIIDFLKENNFSVGLSIDGPKYLNDKYRVFYNETGSVYDSIIEKVEKLNNKDVNYGLSITLSKDIIKNQEEFFDWLQKLKPKSFSYNLMHYTDKTNQWKKYYIDATKFLIKSNNLMFPLGYNEDRIRRKYSAFYDRDFKYSDCAAKGGNQFTIKPNGDILICHGQWNTSENLIGNINSLESINKIFDTKRYNEWYKNIPLNKRKCQNCKALYICGGGCAMQSKDLFNHEKSIDKAFCEHTKYMLDYLLSELYFDDFNKKK